MHQHENKKYANGLSFAMTKHLPTLFVKKNILKNAEKTLSFGIQKNQQKTPSLVITKINGECRLKI